MALFRNRSDAGRRLAAKLREYQDDPDAVVLALPRGGVPVAYEVATALRLALDVYTVRKLGVPGHAELAMGAVACDGSYVVDERTVEMLGVTGEEFLSALQRELAELRRREAAYRGSRPEPDVAGKTVLVVDDGLATGSTMYSAVAALRQRHPVRVVVAVPVAPARTVAELERVADRVVCAFEPEPFYAVGVSYEDFSQVEDDEVRRLLERAERERARWKVA
ncbi:MAG TPA: phosphoribosyltransferase family protein [Verrucomicrobiae bacterium]|nr:phosphoribosyltransferase family protein [Verrucomicrobiae bacterium]